MRSITYILFIWLLTNIYGCVADVESAIVADVSMFRKTHRGGLVDLSEIIRKHIFVGENIKAVERRLKEQGFEVVYPNVGLGKKRYLYAKYIYDGIIVAYDLIHIVVYFENDFVSDIHGSIEFLSL